MKTMGDVFVIMKRGVKTSSLCFLSVTIILCFIKELKIMSRFNYSEPLAEEKPSPISGPKFSTGEVIEGTTDEGELVKGRITAIGERTYRVDSCKRAYTIRMDQARYPVIEPLTESEVKSEETKS